MIHRSFVSVVLVVTFVSVVSFRSFWWLRSFRFDGFVLAFRVLLHACNNGMFLEFHEFETKYLAGVYKRH